MQHNDSKLYSVGCVNWIQPSDTPADTRSDVLLMSDEEFDTYSRWHYLDAVKDLYKKQHRLNADTAIEIDWLALLGYSPEGHFKELCDNRDPFPFTGLDFDHANKLYLHAPNSPDVLFNSTLSVIQRVRDLR